MTVLVVCLTVLNLGLSSSFDPALSVDKNSLEELGHQLFFDETLSFGGNISCAHCHEPKLAFTDGYRKSFNGIGEELHMNSPTLLNLKERKSFNWAQPEITSLTQQIKGPLFNTHPDELGYYKDTSMILNKVMEKPGYKNWLLKNNITTLTTTLILEGLKAYIEKLESRNSKFDNFYKQKKGSLLTSSQYKGYKLFFSKKINCATCHGGQDFYCPEDGIPYATIYKNKSVRIPTLRNVALTSPYMHDGSQTSLLGAINSHFSNMGQTDSRIISIKLTKEEKINLISFLHTLTDTSYLKNSYFIAPNDQNIH